METDTRGGEPTGMKPHQVIEQLREFKSLELTWVVDADIETFFANIPHALIMKLLARKVAVGLEQSLWMKVSELPRAKRN